jgi:hypothetical protein
VHGVVIPATQYVQYGMITRKISSPYLYLHLNSKRGNSAGKQCFFKYHDPNHFGLGNNDRSQILELPKSEWKEPSKQDIEANKVKISNFINHNRYFDPKNLIQN